MDIKETRNSYLNYIFVIFVIFIICRRAWMCDDAFITLRTVDNFVNGYGLTWNISERVQAYTHPLWMLTISFFYFFTREPFYTVIFISILFSCISLILMVKNSGHDTFHTILFCSILAFSRAFIDYSTSGLENPLSHFIIIMFFILYFKSTSSDDIKNIFFLSLIASFGLMNRMDLFLVFFPPLLFTLFERKKINVIKYILLGQLPFIFWEIFSLLYYGFLIPNTAYAKLAHGVSRFIIIKQGITYFYNSIINDPLTIFVIILGILLPLISCKKDKKLIVLSTSILLYLFYTLWIGGDFMSGRFFTVPLVISCIVLLHISPIFSHEQILSLICVILVLGLFLPFNTLSLDVKEYSFNINGVDDERIYFFPGMSLITRYRNHMQPEFEWKDQGIEYRNSGIKVTHARAIGLFGFYCGPNVHIIDGHGLADPLLSHLKVNTTSQFTSGHISKDPPKGYIESLNSGINLISDPKIHKYYDKVLIITRGEIFSWDRIKTIFRMNLGKYDYLL